MAKKPCPWRYAEGPSEHAQQTALFMWGALPGTRAKIPWIHTMYAVPNGGKRDKITASRMRDEGVKRGVPDVHWPMPNGTYHSLYIEMKRPKTKGKAAGRQSPEQEVWESNLTALGHQYVIAYTFDEARLIIEAYNEAWLSTLTPSDMKG